MAGCPSSSDATGDTEAAEAEGTEADSDPGDTSSGSTTTDLGESSTGRTSSGGQADTTTGAGDSSTSGSSGTDAATQTSGDSSGGDVGNGTPFEEACQEYCEPIFECGFFSSEAACRFACEYALVVHADWSDACLEAEQDEWDCIATQDACDPSGCTIDAAIEACAPHVGNAAEDYCTRRQECGLDTPEELQSCTYGAGSFFDGLLAFEPCPAAQDTYLECLTAVSCDVLDARAMGVGTQCADAYNDGVDTCLDAAGLL